jgi:hypothetical protein
MQSSAVNEHCQASATGGIDRLGKSRQAVVACEIDYVYYRATASSHDAVGRLGQRGRPTTRDDHLRPLATDCDGQRTANAAAGSSYNRSRAMHRTCHRFVVAALIIHAHIQLISL